MPNHKVQVIGVDTTRSGMNRVLISQVSPTPASHLNPGQDASPRQYVLPLRSKQVSSPGNHLFDSVGPDATRQSAEFRLHLKVSQ